jgi:F-type H+-transporting ATPase subunit a
MSQRAKVILGLSTYVTLIVAVVVIFGWNHVQNDEFKPQNEFKLDAWFSIGPFEFNKGTAYVLGAAILMCGAMVYIARRMQERPNRVQTLVELAFGLMRDNITRGNMSDKLAAQWFPFIAALFLFVWFSNMLGYLPLPTNTEHKVDLFGTGLEIPSFALFAATANLSIPLSLSLVVFICFTIVGFRAKGFKGYLLSFIPAGVPPFLRPFMLGLELMSNFMRLVSLSVRLFANILAGHLIILFMGGALVIILGIEALGVVTFPLAIALFMFEVGLVATLQAFIFATLTAIYIGGAAAESH